MLRLSSIGRVGGVRGRGRRGLRIAARRLHRTENGGRGNSAAGQRRNSCGGRARCRAAAARERLAPILITALCAGLGLVPLVLGGSKPGHEIEYPMAIVILGGLITSTVLNLVLMPALYWRFGKARR